VKLKRKIEKIIPLYSLLPLLAALCSNFAVYYVSKLLNRGLVHHDMTLPIDAQIPLLPWTTVVYVFAYVLLVVSFVLAARQSRQRVMRFFSAVLLAKLICFVCFVVYPTGVVRPSAEGTQWGMGLLRLLYAADTPDNLFPSIHCLWCGFMVIAVRRRDIPLWYRLLTAVLAACIAVSTLTTKQHVFVDLLAGIPLAFLCYAVADRIGASRLLDRICAWFEERMKIS